MFVLYCVGHKSNSQCVEKELYDGTSGSRVLPSISLPKSGGAIRGMEENTEVNPVIDTCCPDRVKSRDSVYFTLLVICNSGSGNRAYGLG
jgi:hypothetical protein